MLVSSPVENQLAPVNLFSYISPLKSLNLDLIPRAKLGGHWGISSGCINLSYPIKLKLYGTSLCLVRNEQYSQKIVMELIWLY